MHPTPTMPALGPVTPTAQQIAAGRTNLLGLADHTTDGRNGFLVGYLDSILRGLSRHLDNPADREQLTRALALIEAHNELTAEEAAFFVPRDDEPTIDPTTIPYEGISLGRYAR
jgi:hypothetical protein